nr:hypothetical protein [Mycoplasmopsis bovis]
MKSINKLLISDVSAISLSYATSRLSGATKPSEQGSVKVDTTKPSEQGSGLNIRHKKPSEQGSG